MNGARFSHSARIHGSSSIIVVHEGQELTITIRRQALMAVRVIIWAAIAVGAQPPAILLAILIAIILAVAGYHTLSAEISLLASLIVLALVGAVTLPIVLWLGFTKTLIRVDEHYLDIQYCGLFTWRQVRWPKHLVGDVRMNKHAVQILSVDGRQSAVIHAFWPWEDMVVVAMLRQALGMPEL
jgi:hypothetical protein